MSFRLLCGLPISPLACLPFQVMVRGDKVPVYEETLQDNGR